MKLYLMRKLRKLALRFNHITENWVVPNSTELVVLIENTNTPDFNAFDVKLDELRKRWGEYDHYLESYAVRKRLLEFKFERKIT